MIKGKIYKIYSIDENINDVYYGGTIQPLSNRMAGHRRNYKRWKDGKTKNYCSSYQLFDKYGIDKFIIELVESVECDTKEELHMREGYYIKNNNCVNKNIAGRTKKEYKKQYYIDNIVELTEYNKQYKKQYYIDNIVELIEYNKQYYIENKEKITKHKQQYYLDNKEKIAEQRSTIIKCDCGCDFTQSSKSRHLKSKKHLNSLLL